MNRQTPVKTVSYPFLRNAGGNNIISEDDVLLTDGWHCRGCVSTFKLQRLCAQLNFTYKHLLF